MSVLDLLKFAPEAGGAMRGFGGRMVALKDVGELPFIDRSMPSPFSSGLLDYARSAPMTSSIDPSLILAGGALGMFPAGAGAVAGLNAIEPWEAMAQREQGFVSEAEADIQHLRNRFAPGPGFAPKPQPAPGPRRTLPIVTDPRKRAAAIAEIRALAGPHVEITEADISRQLEIIQLGLRRPGAPHDAPRGGGV